MFSRRSRRAPSLTEVGICSLIVLSLSLIFFPVLGTVKERGYEKDAASRLHKYMTGTFLYVEDNDERFPLSIYFTMPYYDGNNDRVAQQLVLPYLELDTLLVDPADRTPRNVREDIQMYPPDTPARRAYNFATKSNWGINWQYYGPLASSPDRPVSIAYSQVQNAPQSLYALDSVWDRTSTGKPYGGGYKTVDPPCVRLVNGTESRPPVAPSSGRYWQGGWNPGNPNSSSVYGSAWNWHGRGFMSVFADGHVALLKLEQLTAGCNVQNGWGGRITDRNAYLWDLQ